MPPYILQTLMQPFIQGQLELILFFLGLPHFLDVFFIEFRLIVGIDLCQSKIDDDSTFFIYIVKEVARFDVAVVYTLILEAFESIEQLYQVVLNIL